MNLDRYKVDKSKPIKLGLGRPAWFMLTGNGSPFEQSVIASGAYKRLPLGTCKRAVMQTDEGQLIADVTGCDDFERLNQRITYLMSTDDPLGMVVERVKGRSMLVALFFSEEAQRDAISAFDEMDEDRDAGEPEVRECYSVRDDATGEEWIAFDPPGGAYRPEVGAEYGSVPITWKIRDRRDGFWKNGECVAVHPAGEARAALVEASEHAKMIRVPRLDRSIVFEDGYEAIEDGSLDGWHVWEWCKAHLKNDWAWVNLGGDGGPYLELATLFDRVALYHAFPDLVPEDDEEGRA